MKSAVRLMLAGALALTGSELLAEQTPIYKSIAPDGTPVFTDQPAPTATLVQPSRLNVMDSPQDAGTSGNDSSPIADSGDDAALTHSAENDAARVSSEPVTEPVSASTQGSQASDASAGPDLDSAQTPTTVDSVTILSPLDRQTLIDPEGPLWVEIGTAPATTLPKGLTAQVRLDDGLVVTGGNTRLPMDVPERGTHRLQVRIVDASGELVAESAPIEIYVKLRVAANPD